MAVARKRKGVSRKGGSSQTKVKQLLAKAKEQASGDPMDKPWARKLHSSRLMFLRNDPDFITVIKIGRVMNALAYCTTNVLTFKDFMTNKTHERQLRRTWMMLGGFLHEAIQVVDAIKGRYLGDPDFEPLRKLVVDHEYLPLRKRAKKVRNLVAFHLDTYDETTRTTISRLKPSTLTLWCGENHQANNFYFELADILDLSYLGDIYPEYEDRPSDESGEKVLMDLANYAIEFLKACHTFQQMLWEKKIKQHVY